MRRFLPGLLAFAIAFGVYYAGYEQTFISANGDEPHYVVEAYSVLTDGDRDLRDDYADAETISRYFVGALGPGGQAFAYTSSPRIVSIHQVGLPVLLVPAVGLGDDLRAVRIELLLLAAFAAAQLLLLLRDLRIAGAFWTWFTWAAVAFSAPLVLFSFQVYPELPAAALVLLALRAAVAVPVRRWRLVAGAVAAALLPWLHVRYLLLAAPLTFALAWRATRAVPGLPGRGERLRAAAPVLGPAAVSLLALGVAFAAWYGSPLPNAPYSRSPDPDVWRNTHLDFLYSYGLGQILSPRHGWWPAAPLGALAVAATPLLWRRYRWWAVLGLATAAVYAATSFTVNPGHALPARYLVVLIPLSAIPLLVAVADVPVSRLALVPLALLGFALSVDAVEHVFAWFPSSVPYVDSPLPRRLRAAWPDMSPRPGDRYPEAALAGLWLAGVAMFGALLAAARSRRA